MLLLLIRHGVTAETGVKLTTPGAVLSPEGLRQAASLVPRLAGVPIDAMYSSPLQRALQTAKPLASARKIRVRIREGLKDVRYGDWEGKPLKSVAKMPEFRQIIASPIQGRFPGGESLAETYARSVAATAAIVDDHPRQTVAVFCHADIIKMAIAHYAGIHMDAYARLAIAPASVSAIWAGSGDPRILRVNDSGSLDDLAPKKGTT